MKNRTWTVTVYVDGKCFAGDVWKRRAARLDSLNGDRLQFTVLGYSYLVGNPNGFGSRSRAKDRSYAKAEHFTGRVLSKEQPAHGQFVTYQVELAS